LKCTYKKTKKDKNAGEKNNEDEKEKKVVGGAKKDSKNVV
jgi:hypothetical protein